MRAECRTPASALKEGPTNTDIQNTETERDREAIRLCYSQGQGALGSSEATHSLRDLTVRQVLEVPPALRARSHPSMLRPTHTSVTRLSSVPLQGLHLHIVKSSSYSCSK